MVGCRPRLTGGPCIWLCLPSTRALSPLQSRQPFPGEQILRTCGLPTASMAEPAPARLAGWLVASTAQPALGPPRAHRSALPTGPSAGFPLTREPGCTPRPRPGSVSSASKLGTCMSSSPQRHQQVPPPPLRAPRHVPRSHRLTAAFTVRVSGTCPSRQSMPCATPSLPTPSMAAPYVSIC